MRADQPEMITPAEVGGWTERMMLDLLHQRFTQKSQGLGDRWVRAEHVRAACGWAGVSFAEGQKWQRRQMRTADFMAQDTWEAQGLDLHGVEVKVSRSDWLTELRDPSKAAAIKRFCNRWWLAVPHKSIVKDDLPSDWGLLVIGRNGRLRVAKSAPPLRPDPMPATFRASLLRAVAKTNSQDTGLKAMTTTPTNTKQGDHQ